MRKSLVMIAILLVVASFSFAGVTLHMLMEDVPETHFVQKLLPDFESKTGIKVEIETMLYEDMHAKLVPQLMSPNCQYDVLEVDNYWAGEFPAAGWLEPLGKYVKESGMNLSVYLPSELDMTGYYNGRLYMIPMYNYAMGLIYRTDLLNDPKLRAKYKELYNREMETPRSVKDYVKLCEFMQKYGGVYGSAMQAERGDPIVMEWTNYLYSLGGRYYNDNWDPVINDKEAVEAVKLYKEAVKNAAPIGALSFNLDDAFRIMAQGKAFSMITYWWMLAQLENPKKSVVAGKVALAPMPGGVGLNGGWGWAIPKNSQHKKEAWEFIKWVESFRIAKERALMGGAPTRFDVFTDMDVVSKMPWYPAAMWLIMKARHIPEFQFSTQMVEIVGRELSLAVSGNKKIEDALNDAMRQLKSLPIQAGIKK